MEWADQCWQRLRKEAAPTVKSRCGHGRSKGADATSGLGLSRLKTFFRLLMSVKLFLHQKWSSMVQAWQIQGFFEAPWFYSKCEKDPWSKALSESSSNVHWGKSAPKSHKYICPGANHVSHRPQLSFKAQFSQRVSFFSNTAVEASPPLSRMYCSEIRHSFRLSTDWCALNECSREIHIIICIYEMIWGVVAMVKRLLESCHVLANGN